MAPAEHIIVWASELIPQGASESKGRARLPVVSSQRPGSWNSLLIFHLSLAEGCRQAMSSLALHVCLHTISKGFKDSGHRASHKYKCHVLGIHNLWRLGWDLTGYFQKFN